MFDDKKIFDFPKPVTYIEQLIKLCSDEQSIIMDFFGGSATTAHAVMDINAKEHSHRKFIIVQGYEKVSEESDAFKSGYRNICEIGKDRIRRAGKEILKNYVEENVDVGFKVFKASNTNIKWNSLLSNGQLDLTQIEVSPDQLDFMPDSKDEDIVYELILRQRDVPLSEKMDRLSNIGERIYLYADSYLVCLESKITEEMVDKLAGLDPVPVKFIFRDSAFGDDIALKDETFRRLKAVIDKNAGDAKVSYTVEFI